MGDCNASDVDTFADDLNGIFADFPFMRKPNESQTEDDLIWPVLARLGWSDTLRQQNLAAHGRADVPDGLLFANSAVKTQANALSEEWRRYALGLAIVESKRWNRPLDRRTSGKRGAEEQSAPSTQMSRYLRRVEDLTDGKLRWGILTNGARWRLYFQGAKSVAEDFFEIDLAAVLGIDDGSPPVLDEATRHHGLRLFVTIFRREAFVPDGPSNTTFHTRALQLGRFYEERVANSLSALVYDRVFPMLACAIAAVAPKAKLTDVRDASLVLLYRLLFVLYAEDRNLLPVNDRRYDKYGLRTQVRDDVGRRKGQNDVFSKTAFRYWVIIEDLTRAIDKGDPAIGLPPYNGGLFDVARTSLLTKVRLGDEVMADVVDALSFEQTEGHRRYINYRDLSVQQLGSIYERLLERELVREGQQFDVRMNTFARKDPGSFYTPDGLVRLIVHETLDPLITDCLDTFRRQVKALAADARHEDRRLGILEGFDPAARLLDLKICDPAMGSGHFLVSLVDYLTDQVIAAMAEAEVIVDWADYLSPVAGRIADIRRTICKNAEDNSWTVDLDQLDDRHIIRRMVLKRCVYGVDKNPMAVELAKVALWLHTFTVGAPLSFLDHHLHVGDSLFGAWVNGTMAAVERLGGGPLFLHQSIREAKSSAAEMRQIEKLTDAEIAEARNSAEMFDGVKIRTAPLNRFMATLHALNWLNLQEETDRLAIRAWLDGTFGDAVDIALGKLSVSTKLGYGPRFAAILSRARALVNEQRFLNWQVTFPGVWSDWEADRLSGGFDAVIGNPPWDRMKLQQLEWFASRRPEIAAKSRAADRKKLVEKLVKSGDPLAEEFKLAERRANDALRMARFSSALPARDSETGKRTSAPSDQYPLLSGGDINIYSLFVERAHTLAKPGGMVGLLVPIGVGTDKTSAKYISDITENQRIKAFIAFENRHKWLFKDVHAEDQPTVLVVSNAERRYPQFRYAVKLHALPDEQLDPTIEMDAATLLAVNPNTGTMPIFRTSTDARIVPAIYARTPVFIRKSGQDETSDWGFKYLTMFHMSNDSGLFRNKSELENEESAWPTGAQHFQSKTGTWLPLYEGKTIQIYNHRYASIITPAKSVSGQGQSIHSSLTELSSPDFVASPRYWVNSDNIKAIRRGYAIGFNDVCNTNNERSLVAAIVPRIGAGNTLPLLDNLDAADCSLLVANLNSTPCDYVARNKIQSRHLNKYILEQLPVLPPAAYTRKVGAKTTAEIIHEAVLELTYTAHDMAPFARDLGWVGARGKTKAPFRWDEGRRLKLRAKLDALYFFLYGVFDPDNPTQGRDDIRYIYSTFPIVERTETALYGRYRSRDLCLAWLNAIAAGHPDAEVDG